MTTTQPARIEAFEETPLFAKVTGYVKKIHKDIGDPVGAGEALVTLDVPELADDVAQKEALLAQAEAELKQAAANVTAVGYGFDRPVALNDTEANMQKNRRTDVYIRKGGAK